jgi:hypothetical protein
LCNMVVFPLPMRGPPASSASATGPAALAAGGQCCPVVPTGPPASDARVGSRRNMPGRGGRGGQDILTYQKEQGPRWVGTPSHQKLKWVGTPSHYKTQMGWNSKPGRISSRNPNGLELQDTTKIKWLGTPNHYKTQMGWNSKPGRISRRNPNGLELQDTTNSNGLELQAMAKCKELRTPSHD